MVLQELALVDKSPIRSGSCATHNCTKKRPCNRWRDCATCARRRQAKIADATQLLFDYAGQLRWHILYPAATGAAALKKARADWLRHTAPIGAVWTVEQSRKTGALHCNIITPAGSIHEPATGHYWNQTITGDVRAVGAYIAKREQMPSTTAYTGRLYGTTGQIWEILMTQNQSPALAAAAAQHAINSHAAIERTAHLQRSASQQSRMKWPTEEREAARAADKPLEYYRNIATRWIPDILHPDTSGAWPEGKE